MIAGVYIDTRYSHESTLCVSSIKTCPTLAYLTYLRVKHKFYILTTFTIISNQSIRTTRYIQNTKLFYIYIQLLSFWINIS